MAYTEDASRLAERLIGAYTVEAEIYQALLALAREQGILLEESEDVGRCAALFERKDELLRSISAIEAELEPLKYRWWGEDVGIEAREQLNGLLDCILATIEAIMEQEQRNERLLLADRAEAEPGLGRVRDRAAVGHSQTSDDPLPRLIDTRR